MTKTGFKRIFTDNNEYESYGSISFFDSLAYTVQEFLYTSKAKSEEADYRMDKHVKLYDFMNISAAFIKCLDTNFGRTDIKGYVDEIKQTTYSLYENWEYKYDILIVSHASNELVMALLWTTYIYANTFLQITQRDLWKKTVRMLYEVMQEYSLYPEKQFKTHPLILLTDEATQVMTNHILDKCEIDPEEVEYLEQESEQEKIEDEEEPYQQEETKPNSDVAEEITLHDKVRLDLLLRLMKNDGANTDKHGNKTIAAQLMQSITGLPLQTCKNYCSNRDLNVKTHSEEVLKMNTLLQALGMKIRL